ncbi:hypothetical protein IPG41_02620 [Candidatus Peregrinibacteria bacterium]|nr:MAG: hypothetical protein IPG41_02620 [Candidatus Peregrinibacteria bacterium]
MSLKEDFKAAYAKERQKQKTLQSAPDSPAKRRTNRLGALAMLFIALVFTGINCYTWEVHGFLNKWTLTIMLAFLGLGLYALITGKMPTPKK